MEGYLLMGAVGAFLSALFGLLMFALLITDSESRMKVRLRMLMWLAFQDSLAGICGLGYINNMDRYPDMSLNDIDEWPVSQQVWNGLLVFWTWGSYMWTACIATHAVFLVRHKGSAGNPPQRRPLTEAHMERRYCVAW